MASKGGEAPAVSLLADQMQIFEDLSLTAVTSRTLPDRRTLTAMVPSHWMPILCHRSVQPWGFFQVPLAFAECFHHEHNTLSSCTLQHMHRLSKAYIVRRWSGL